jgi:O-antigen ligase
MAAATRNREPIFAALFGVIVAIVLSKMGNPVIFKNMEVAPTNLAEAIFATWPSNWYVHAFTISALLLVVALIVRQNLWSRIKLLPAGVVLSSAAWIVWLSFSYPKSVAPDLTGLAYPHLIVSSLLIFLGSAFLTPASHRAFFRIMIFAFLFALWLGLDQHYGGLEATRKAFYETPGWENAPQEMKLKVASSRIFGPYVYPNTFAGVIMIWAPVLTLTLWNWTERLPSIVQKVLVGLFAYATVACFFWTGSKAGWLIAIAVFVVALMHLKNVKQSIKIGIIVATLVLGLTGFALKFRSYFEKGATSASARLIYWKAAVQVANAHPVFGAGPGTFAKTFAPIKPPEAEMARLVHNDYLEQACDSGWPAFVFFVGLIGSALAYSHKAVSKSPLHLAAWLGVLAWALQSCVEFGLYIPAISWSAFVLLGWLLASRIAIDTDKPAK